MRLSKEQQIRATNELLAMLAENRQRGGHGLRTSEMFGTPAFHGERTLSLKQIVRLLRQTGKAVARLDGSPRYSYTVRLDPKVMVEKLNRMLIGWPSYLRRVLDSINSDSDAKQAFRKLVQGGCDPRRLLENLNAYCGGTSAEARAALKTALNFRDRLKKAAKRLEEDAELIERMLKDRQQYAGITTHSPVDLPAELREFAELLAALSRSYDRTLKNVRPNRKGNITAGRTGNLVEMVWQIEESQPTLNPYPLLARLVSAIRRDGRVECLVADALRNAVQRMR